MKTIGLLRRWSTPHQNEGYRNAVQIDDMIRRVEALGYDYIVYDEGQITGQKISKRKIFQQLIADLKTKKIHGLGALDIKRITRDRRGGERATIKEILMDAGAVLITLDQVIDLSDANDAMIYDIFGALAGYEITTIRNTFWQGNIRRRLAGPPTNGSKAPFGYQHKVLKIRSNGKAERFLAKSDDPSRQAQVSKLFEIAMTAPTYSFVARDMNRLGHYFPGNDGSLVPWQQINVKSTITNPVYSGRLGVGKRQASDVWNLNEETKQGTVWRMEPDLAYLDVATQDYIIDRIQTQRRRPSRALGVENPLLGILRCGCCGGQMYFTRLVSKRKDENGEVERDPYQYCKNHTWSKETCPHGGRLKQVKALEAIFSYVDVVMTDALRDQSLHARLTDAAALNEDLIRLQNTVTVLEKKEKHAKHLMATLSEDPEDAASWLAVLQETREELKASREELRKAQQVSQSQDKLSLLAQYSSPGGFKSLLYQLPWYLQKNILEDIFTELQVTAEGPMHKREYRVTHASYRDGREWSEGINSETSLATSFAIYTHLSSLILST